MKKKKRNFDTRTKKRTFFPLSSTFSIFSRRVVSPSPPPPHTRSSHAKKKGYSVVVSTQKRDRQICRFSQFLAASFSFLFRFSSSPPFVSLRELAHFECAERLFLNVCCSVLSLVFVLSEKTRAELTLV